MNYQSACTYLSLSVCLLDFSPLINAQHFQMKWNSISCDSIRQLNRLLKVSK